MLQVPLELAFHNCESSPAVEEEIRRHVDKLEKLFDGLTSVRVRVDQRANASTGNTPPVVRIELGIPGHKDLVVSHEPDRLQRKFQAPDIHNAINSAFHIAERQLVEMKERMQGR